MAPRTAKPKKAADVKVSENDAPNKGRGKAKHIEEVEQELPKMELNGKAVPDKKAKRGKKADESNAEHTNGGDTAPPAKRGRKKNVEELVIEEEMTNGDHSNDEESPEGAQNGGLAETNGHLEEAPVSTGKGRKKQAKKEEKSEVKSKETTRERKAKQEGGDAEEREEPKEVVEEKQKGRGRGRKAQPKADAEPETEEKTETVMEDKVETAATKGRKKAPSKEKAAAKEKTPESEKEELPEEQMEDQPEEEPKKKETKGRKGQGKKVQAKEMSKVKDDVEKEEPAESEKEELPEEQMEDQPEEEPKKKETKGRKGQGKKVQAKEMSKEKDDVEKEEPASKKRKVNKKDDKGTGDAKDEKANEEVAESKPKGKRGKKAAESAAESHAEEPQDTGEEDSSKRKQRKPADEKAEDKKPPLNKTTTKYEDIDFCNNSKTSQGKDWNFKMANWNVGGIRSWLGKGGLDYLKYERPDILCLQETKCAQDKLPEEVLNVPGYHAYWLSSNKDGYAGVCIYTTRLAMNVQYGLQNKEFDDEGRIITAEYEHFYLICTYVPNAGRGLVTLPKRLKWNEEFRKYVKELDKKKPVIICGDMNVAHNEIDLANPKTNKKNAGFTPEEREGMTQLLADGFVDTFRHLYPDRRGAYTFWSFMKNSRAKNVGWRLDYFIVSERLLPSVCDNVIRDQVYGSDHCPLSLFLHLSSADKPTE